MPPAKAPASNSVLRNLPSVDELLRSGHGIIAVREAGERRAVELARTAIEEIRSEIKDAAGDNSKENLTAAAVARFENGWRIEQLSGIRRVINATGVVIHTNLGRAPLSENARRAIFDAGAAYCTLEYDLESGKRGRRGPRAEKMLTELTGAEGVLIVNNCAAAAFFILTV